ncbi:transposase [Bacillus sp. SL00103]
MLHLPQRANFSLIITTTREGYKQYASDSEVCESCSFLDKCTQSQNHTKQIHRHIWRDYLDEADNLRLTEINKSIYIKRERKRLNAFLRMQRKAWYALDETSWTEKVPMQAMPYFQTMNQKLANWTWKVPCPYNYMMFSKKCPENPTFT